MAETAVRSTPSAVSESPAQQQLQFPYRFFVVTFAWSWGLCVPIVLASHNFLNLGTALPSAATLPILVLAVYGPAVGAFYSIGTLHGPKALLRYLAGVFNLNLGWKAWMIPPAVLGLLTCLAWRLPELWGAPHLSARIPQIGGFAQLLLIMLFLAGGQEELGWRGYILDPLEQRLGPWLGSVVLGIVWAIWHLPVFLIPGIGMDYTPPLAFLLLTIGLSWFFAWVRQASGRRTFSGLYVHGLFNTLGSIFPITVMSAGAPQTRYWIWASLIFVAGLSTVIIRSRSRVLAQNSLALNH